MTTVTYWKNRIFPKSPDCEETMAWFLCSQRQELSNSLRGHKKSVWLHLPGLLPVPYPIFHDKQWTSKPRKQINSADSLHVKSPCTWQLLSLFLFMNTSRPTNFHFLLRTMRKTELKKQNKRNRTKNPKTEEGREPWQDLWISGEMNLCWSSFTGVTWDPMEGPHGGTLEEERAAEKISDELAPFPTSSVMLVGRRERIQNWDFLGRWERYRRVVLRFSLISHYPTLI